MHSNVLCMPLVIRCTRHAIRPVPYTTLFPLRWRMATQVLKSLSPAFLCYSGTNIQVPFHRKKGEHLPARINKKCQHPASQKRATVNSKITYLLECCFLSTTVATNTFSIWPEALRRVILPCTNRDRSHSQARQGWDSLTDVYILIWQGFACSQFHFCADERFHFPVPCAVMMIPSTAFSSLAGASVLIPSLTAWQCV